MAQYNACNSYCDVFVVKINLILLSIFKKLLCVIGLQDFLSKNRRAKNQKVIAQKWSVKMVFLSTVQSSQENTCARVPFLINFQACNLALVASKKCYSHYIVWSTHQIQLGRSTVSTHIKRNTNFIWVGVFKMRTTRLI